jgi:hypothetical protein
MNQGTPRPRPPTAAEARAEVEARRDEVRAARQEAMRERYGDEVPGRSIIVVSWASTAVFTVATAAAVIAPDAAIVAFFAVAVVLFLAGCAVFLVDLGLAAARSRDDAMGIGGLFFLAGSAPPSVQRHLLGSLGVQVVVAIVGAALDPFTPLAFGTLVPTLGLALCGLWAVRHGVFEPRVA